METSKVPPHIVETINTLLAPYGQSYSPSGGHAGYRTRQEACELLRVSLSTLDREVRAGNIPYLKYAAAVRFRLSDLIAYAESHRK